MPDRHSSKEVSRSPGPLPALLLCHFDYKICDIEGEQPVDRETSFYVTLTLNSILRQDTFPWKVLHTNVLLKHEKTDKTNMSLELYPFQNLYRTIIKKRSFFDLCRG